jgi:O-antigen ligase
VTGGLPDMASVSTGAEKRDITSHVRAWSRIAAIWLFVAVLAWSPFPLGGAIGWAPGLQEMLIAACWIVWIVSTAGARGESWFEFRVVLVPLAIALLVLAWAVVQVLPIVPVSWAHPIWSMASDTLGRHIPAVISMNPWRTEQELLKLASYAVACWLAFAMASRSESARVLFNAIIAIGAAYVMYALVLASMRVTQVVVFYSFPSNLAYGSAIAGPFMLKNSFATYCGLAAMAAIAKLIAMSNQTIVTGRGFKRLALTAMQFVFGRGAPILVASLLALTGVVVSASRAGFISALCGLAAMAAASLLGQRRSLASLWIGSAVFLLLAPLLVLVVLAHGTTLGGSFYDLLQTGTADNIRLTLWSAASRMIGDAPWLGLGLGTFQDAYPLYATRLLPFVMDKAHCDYLEFAAGIGLPAAIAWWGALAWLFFLCLRGARIRRRNRVYPIAAIGATVLVAVHSSVDFSLQLPAVALVYAALLGIGVAQALPTRRNA